MIKQVIVDQTIAAATQMLENLQGGNVVETINLDKWSEALIRYVFYKIDERTHSQDIKNMVERIAVLDLSPRGSGVAEAMELLPRIIANIQEESLLENLNGTVVWEPIFERAMLFPN